MKKNWLVNYLPEDVNFKVRQNNSEFYEFCDINLIIRNYQPYSEFKVDK